MWYWANYDALKRWPGLGKSGKLGENARAQEMFPGAQSYGDLRSTIKKYNSNSKFLSKASRENMSPGMRPILLFKAVCISELGMTEVPDRDECIASTAILLSIY